MENYQRSYEHPQDKIKSKTSSGAEINERHYKQTMGDNDDIFNCADYERELE